MTTIATTLGTTYFQLSTVGVGALAVGIEDIRQRINNVLSTIPGTDPLRPLFGSYVYHYVDKPLNVAIPNIKKEIFDSLSLWMPEIEIRSITHTVKGESQLNFNVTYLIIDDDLLDSIIYSSGDITGTTDSNSIIITALVPVKVTNGIYRVVFIVNGEDVRPDIPAIGFVTASEMLTWITSNWSNYGKWYLTSDTLVLYLNSGIAKTASLVVTENVELTVKSVFPTLIAGEFYSLTFNANGISGVPAFPDNTYNTIQGVLIWINNNWNEYGSWFVISELTDGLGDFSADFSEDFNNDGQKAIYTLVLQTNTLLTADINFN
jgi:phage baseplate assembly protein W